MSRGKTIILYLVLAVVCMAAARPVEARLAAMRQSSGMAACSGTGSRAGAAGMAFVRCLGGLRSILADLIWIRALRMQEEKRSYEVVTLLDGLLVMQPHFTSVWKFQAEVLAFDFTAQYDSSESLRWAERGINVLERGVELNPSSGMLEESLAHVYMRKLAPNPYNDWKSLVNQLNRQLAGEGPPPGQEPLPLDPALVRTQLARLAEHDGQPQSALDMYTGLRLARWHFLQASQKTDSSASRKLLCERMAVRCLEAMGDWAGAERAWRVLYERQGRQDPMNFFREFMNNLVCEELLLGHVRESREAFGRLRRDFPEAPAEYRDVVARGIKTLVSLDKNERAVRLYWALCVVEPGEKRSFEEISGRKAPQSEPHGPQSQ